MTPSAHLINLSSFVQEMKKERARKAAQQLIFLIPLTVLVYVYLINTLCEIATMVLINTLSEIATMVT